MHDLLQILEISLQHPVLVSLWLFLVLMIARNGRKGRQW
jgi:hypothetical protein